MSVHVKWTTTLLVYQPFVPSVPLATVALIVGLVLSILNVSESDAALPARSSQVDETTTAVPSLLDPLVWVQFAGSIPDPASVQFHATKTSLVYQQFEPDVPVTSRASTGGVWSILKLALSTLSSLPALSSLAVYMVCVPSLETAAPAPR